MVGEIVNLDVMRSSAKEIILIDFPPELSKLGCVGYKFGNVLFVDRNCSETEIQCVSVSDFEKEKAATTAPTVEAG